MASLANDPVESADPGVSAGRTPERYRLWGRFTPVAQREIILALLLILCYGFFRQTPFWNENSRYDLVRALVDDHSTRIDPYQANTGDKSFYRGHYYSDKAPGSAFMGVPVYALIRDTSMLAGIDQPDSGRVMQALAFTAAGIPTVLLALLLLRFLRSMVEEPWALIVTAGYALGTMAFPFATMYFGHAATTFFLFAAFYALWRARSTSSVWPIIIAGFLAGWAVLTDFSAALGVAPLLVYALTRGRRGPLLMALGGVPPALLLLGYNWVSFGGPFSLGYTNLANNAFAAGMSHGVLGVSTPKLPVLKEVLVGTRGLLRQSPWLAFALAGLWAARRPGRRQEVALCAVIVAAFLTANAGYYLPLGGATPGPRFLTPALPFAAVLVALAPRHARLTVVLLIAFSVVLMFAAVATMPNVTEGVKDPIFDLWLPRLLGRDLGETTAWLRWGFHGLQPLYILGYAAVLACAGLYATTRARPVARQVTGVAVALLALLVLAFGTPIELPAGFSLKSASAQGNVAMAVADAGLTHMPAHDGRPHTGVWAQMENVGPAVEHTAVVFSVSAPSGERIWAAWYSDVSWRAHERKRLGV